MRRIGKTQPEILAASRTHPLASWPDVPLDLDERSLEPDDRAGKHLHLRADASRADLSEAWMVCDAEAERDSM